MMKTYFIGADVHKQSTSIAVRQNNRIIAMETFPTRIENFAAYLAKFKGHKELAIEESSLASWLYLHLHDKVDRLIFCDPRRNRLICDDGDKDDPVDAAKLTELLANRSLREIHHSTDETHLAIKQWTAIYHDRVKDQTRLTLKMQACAAQHGIAWPRIILTSLERRETWLAQLESPVLAKQLHLLFLGYDSLHQQVELARKEMIACSKHISIIQHWQQLPAIGPIRAITLYAYLETPDRFKTKSSLWKYCGIGLERCTSGTDKKGRPKPARLRLARRANYHLKNAMLGAAHMLAVQCAPNIFTQQYERMLNNGMSPSNALHALARKLLTVMWGMWKTQSAFKAQKALKTSSLQQIDTAH